MFSELSNDAMQRQQDESKDVLEFFTENFFKRNCYILRLLRLLRYRYVHGHSNFDIDRTIT